MHPTQKKLLALSQTQDIRALGLRQIGRMIGEEHPQKIKYHLKRLGILPDDEVEKVIDKKEGPMISIPLMGLANCGPATIFAQPLPEGHLQVSKKLIGLNTEGLFAVKAVGDSMNRANIDGKSIDDGDYVVVDSNDKDFKNGEYVLSAINGLANIKKFTKDSGHGNIVLLSESKMDYPPIFIHEADFENYATNGKIVAVLKQPKELEDYHLEKIDN